MFLRLVYFPYNSHTESERLALIIAASYSGRKSHRRNQGKRRLLTGKKDESLINQFTNTSGLNVKVKKRRIHHTVEMFFSAWT